MSCRSRLLHQALGRHMLLPGLLDLGRRPQNTRYYFVRANVVPVALFDFMLLSLFCLFDD